MRIEDAARKLRPLLPEKVDGWLRARQLAEPEFRELIDRQILFEASRRLGDWQDRVLLSLPTEKQSRGSIHLGTVIYDQPQYSLGISENELLQNLAIFGRSGAGKTNVVFHLLEQLIERKVPFVFFDWKRTGRHLLERINLDVYTVGRKLRSFSFNPFICPPGIEPHTWYQKVTDIMGDAYTFGEASRSVLLKALMKTAGENRSVNPLELIQQINQTQTGSRSKGWRESVTRALESLHYSSIIPEGDYSQEQIVSSLLQGRTILELDGLSDAAKKFLMPCICLWLFQSQISSSRREKLSLVLIIEEAHHVLYKKEGRSSESALEALLRQCREIGISMIIVDQHPSLVSSVVQGNCYTTIFLNLKDPSDISKAGSIASLGEDQKHLNHLPTGQGIVKLQDRWTKPVLVQFPLCVVKKGAVSDERLLEYSNRKTLSGEWRTETKDNSTFWQLPTADAELSSEELTFLDDVKNHPDDGVSIRYKRCNLSGEKGNRLKNKLINRGILEQKRMQVGRTHRMMLRTRETLSEEIESGSKPSIEHEYWKRVWTQKLKMSGYDVEVEAKRKQRGRMDICASKGKVVFAVEIETGKSDVSENVRQNLRDGLSEVWLIATNMKAREKIERQLAKDGLLLPERVQLLNSTDKIPSLFH